MNINRQTLRLYDCLDLVLRLEIDSRRSILDLSSAHFLALAREGEDALYARADSESHPAPRFAGSTPARRGEAALRPVDEFAVRRAWCVDVAADALDSPRA